MNDLLAEDELRRLLTEAADAAPAPGRAAEDLLAALVDPAPAGDRADTDPHDDRPIAVPTPLRQRLSPRLVGVAAAVVLVVALIGVTLAGGGTDSASHEVASKAADLDTALPSTTVAANPQAAFDSSAAGGGGAASAAGPLVERSAVPSPPVLGSATAAPVSGDAGTTDLAAAAAPTDSAKVVKTGSLELQVRKGAFQGTVDAVSTKAVGLGGYVADATTASSSGSPSGTITVRVPSSSFDRLLAELRKLGKVQAVTQKGTEVTAQYTDLQARLSSVTATRERLATVLSKATTVPDILSVQDRITDVQTQIEQLQGQIKLLDDQTSMGTLAVSVAEPGAKVVVQPNPDDRTLGTALSEARHRFGNGIEAVVAWSGSAAAVLLIGLVGLVLARLLWIRLRRYHL